MMLQQIVSNKRATFQERIVRQNVETPERCVVTHPYKHTKDFSNPIGDVLMVVESISPNDDLITLRFPSGKIEPFFRHELTAYIEGMPLPEPKVPPTPRKRARKKRISLSPRAHYPEGMVRQIDKARSYMTDISDILHTGFVLDENAPQVITDYIAYRATLVMDACHNVARLLRSTYSGQNRGNSNALNISKELGAIDDDLCGKGHKLLKLRGKLIHDRDSVATEEIAEGVRHLQAFINPYLDAVKKFLDRKPKPVEQEPNLRTGDRNTILLSLKNAFHLHCQRRMIQLEYKTESIVQGVWSSTICAGGDSHTLHAPVKGKRIDAEEAVTFDFLKERLPNLEIGALFQRLVNEASRAANKAFFDGLSESLQALGFLESDED